MGPTVRIPSSDAGLQLVSHAKVLEQAAHERLWLANSLFYSTLYIASKETLLRCLIASACAYPHESADSVGLEW